MDLHTLSPEDRARCMAEVEYYRNSIRGCLFGGAAGDALGYPVEFFHMPDIYGDYGLYGITEYETHNRFGKALISDDTQMTLFTANGLLFGKTRAQLRGISGSVSSYVALAYKDWYMTQSVPFGDRPTDCRDYKAYISWLCDVPELYYRRAPGTTCLNALSNEKNLQRGNYITPPLNHSKGCGGVMRVAPLALIRWHNTDALIREAAQVAAITHGHPLGYMPAALLCYIIHEIVFSEEAEVDLKKLVLEGKDAVCRLFQADKYTRELSRIIDLAVELSENQESDIDNISCLGEGWVAEEALAIAIYCSLQHQDFSSGIIAAVNHNGDSDSTGAITGNILGALNGYRDIEDQWKENLELTDVILEIADDLCYACGMHGYSPYQDAGWIQKYVHARRESPTV